MNQLKFEFAKLGLIISWFGSAMVGIFLFYDFVIKNKQLLSLPLTIIVFILFSFLLYLQYPMTKLRNKYRDLIEYDNNGISIKYGNFSNLSNQERKEIEKQKMLQREMLIDSVTLKNITKSGSKNPDEDIKQIIGLENVKKEIHKMKARLVFNKELKRKKKNQIHSADNSAHMCLFGPPGTGKTSMVKIITGYLYQYGYIKKNKYIEVDGNFFNGTSIGESTKKISYIIGQAMGGVLFIDEAYALLNNNESQEVIATLVKSMEDKRNDIVVILAGYEKEMNLLINSNTGLQSRIKYYLHFKNYNIDELWDIFILMAKQRGFYVSNELKNTFAGVMLEEMQKKNYGNARTVRKVLDIAIDNHSVNFMDNKIPKEKKYILQKIDLVSQIIIKNTMMKGEY